MPTLGPIKRSELVRLLKRLGFEGPYSGGNHQYLVRDSLKVWIPNPHQGDISKGLLIEILKQAGISRDVWENL
jgi:predicted RNA binding protein YcfA (HicA-like mRNA interferase family)